MQYDREKDPYALNSTGNVGLGGGTEEDVQVLIRVESKTGIRSISTSAHEFFVGRPALSAAHYDRALHEDDSDLH